MHPPGSSVRGRRGGGIFCSVGGAVLIDTSSGGTIYKTTFTQNSADLAGSVAYVDGAGSGRVFDGAPGRR